MTLFPPFISYLCNILVGRMCMKREENWYKNYQELQTYIEQHGQLPDKKKVENRGLLNWWKYNMKMVKQGKMEPERERLLAELGQMRLVHR